MSDTPHADALRALREKKFARDRLKATKKKITVVKRLIPYAGKEKRDYHELPEVKGPLPPRGKRKIGRPAKAPSKPAIKHSRRTELPEDFK